jgi:hypothetical protein
LDADRIAERVMQTGGGQRRHANERDGEDQQRAGHLVAKDVEPSGLTGAPPIVHEVLRTQGQPIDPAARAFLEPRFGTDFSRIRVHSDEKAGDAARAVDALAYTVGRHLVFGEGQYSPDTTSGRHLLAHELAHSIQQESAADTGGAIQRQAAVVDIPSSEEVVEPDRHVGFVGDDLRNGIQALIDQKTTGLETYRRVILNAPPEERRFALRQEDLLLRLGQQMDALSFARCVELLGRRAPTFDELRTNRVVQEAIAEAWEASEPGTHPDLMTNPHEQAGWVFMNLIDGRVTTERAAGKVGRNFLQLEQPPNLENSVVVGSFHTHPNLGPRDQATPDALDRDAAERGGVPDLVVGSPTKNPKVFQIYLSGPPSRKHLASDTKLPGRSGGIAP